MFDNIGGKIKGLAKIICWIGIIACVITGIALISDASKGDRYYRYTDGGEVFAGILVMILGSVLSWVGSFVLYGFGELVENSAKLVSQIKPDDTCTNTKKTPEKLENEDEKAEIS